MTVIAFDGRTVAADKRSTNNGSIRTATKLFARYNDDGTVKDVVAINGAADHGMALRGWYYAGANPEQYPRSLRPNAEDFAFLVVFRPGMKVVEYQCGPVPIVVEDELFSAGCGRDAALAAMMAGADAKRAVQITSQIDCHCGNGVDFVELYGDVSGAGGTGAAAPGASASV